MRPTLARVKEALFDIIVDRVNGSRFLDLYAGAGGVGIEALSRGAEKVVFVENHRPAVETIRGNLAACGFSSGFRVIRSDVLRFLNGAGRRSDEFDIVFMDPPYDSDLMEKTMLKLGALNIIERDSLVIGEHSSSRKLEHSYGRLVKDDLRRFGSATLSFYDFHGKAL